MRRLLFGEGIGSLLVPYNGKVGKFSRVWSPVGIVGPFDKLIRLLKKTAIRRQKVQHF